MLIRIPHVLGPAQLASIQSKLAAAPFVDGRLSAGKMAAPVKNNEELARDASIVAELNELVMGNLIRHPVYQGAALPLRAAAPFYARYRSGMAYGSHVDDPVMGSGAPYRSDIAVTVFLSEPTDYDGGELVVETSFGEQSIKWAAGDAVLYPASSMHHVAPVTRGTRLVAVTWVQSLVRDGARRALLYELHRAREQLLKVAPRSEALAGVDHVYANLVRMWAEV